MYEAMGIEARMAWAILTGELEKEFHEGPEVPYGDQDRLDLLSARELLDLMAIIRTKLAEKGYVFQPSPQYEKESFPEPSVIHINSGYHIFIECLGMREITLQPLQKTIFILFLKHPEGILFKERAFYKDELLDIYARICPNTEQEMREHRIDQLISPDTNNFSENLSRINKKLEDILGSAARPYQIYGANGRPRRIDLDPTYIHWEH